jgi:hypothetical protein
MMIDCKNIHNRIIIQQQKRKIERERDIQIRNCILRFNQQEKIQLKLTSFVRDSDFINVFLITEN